MKKILLLFIFSLTPLLANSKDLYIGSKCNLTHIDLLKSSFLNLYQTNESNPKSLSEHKYLFFSLGIAYDAENINIKNENSRLTTKVSGAGLGIDLKMGFALSKNLIIHATYISQSLRNPESSSNYGWLNTNFSKVKESMFGAGFSCYSTQSPFFFSGTLGSGNFQFKNDFYNTPVTTKKGLSLQLKIGLSAWIAKQVALAVALEYVRTSSTNQTVEKINSNRFGLALNISFN
jgi:hypothetical protein